MSACDVSRDFFRSRWASPSINLVCLLGWPFYNSKSSIPNKSVSLFGRKTENFWFTQPLQWSDLVLAKTLIETPHRLSASLMSPLNKPQELWSITVALVLSLLISLVLTGLRLRFSSSSYQKVIQTAPKSLLRSPILAQAELWERPSKLNNTAKTPGSHYTLFAAFLLCETIV